MTGSHKGLMLAAMLCGACAASCGDRETEQPRPEASQSKATKAPAQSAAPESGHLIESTEIDELRAAGLTDPIQQLVDSLMAHPEIIPHPGAHHDTRMRFYPREIHVLNAHAVFARFDDGHIVGSGVFGFTIEPSGRITWKVLSSTAEEFSFPPGP